MSYSRLIFAGDRHQMFSGLELLLMEHGIARAMKSFNALSGLSCYVMLGWILALI